MNVPIFRADKLRAYLDSPLNDGSLVGWGVDIVYTHVLNHARDVASEGGIKKAPPPKNAYAIIHSLPVRTAFFDLACFLSKRRAGELFCSRPPQFPHLTPNPLPKTTPSKPSTPTGDQPAHAEQEGRPARDLETGLHRAPRGAVVRLQEALRD
jgi:hypothetical protein